MFDNLRDPANTNPTPDETAGIHEVPLSYVPPPNESSQRRFLCMTAPQRLIVAVLMMISACVLGAMCLLVTGRISPF
jgi:hypothetical protein